MFHVKLSRLAISGVRNLEQVELEGFGDINILYGDNGAGKTSVLEAIHILGLARSFRSTQLQPVIHYESSSCTVFGQLQREGRVKPVSLGVERARRSRYRVRIDGQEERQLVRLADTLPLQLIDSGAYGLLEGGPKPRRQLIDWGVFHVEQQFYNAWKRLQRAVKQRNSLMRAVHSGKATGGIEQQLDQWDAEIVKAAVVIDGAREKYLAALIPAFRKILDDLIPIPGLSAEYFRGWDEKPLGQALREGRPRDMRRGITHAGPHRSDLRIAVNGIDSGLVLSRGQQKLVICALRMAQCQVLAAMSNNQKRCLVLIDDLPAEIDHQHQGRLRELLQGLGMQLFLTCVAPEGLAADRWSADADVRMFHVKQGSVEPVA